MVVANSGFVGPLGFLQRRQQLGAVAHLRGRQQRGLRGKPGVETRGFHRETRGKP